MSDKSDAALPAMAEALSVVSLSACLTEAVRTPVVSYVGAAPEGYDAPPHGAGLRAGRWMPPASITADMVVEANRWRQQHAQRNGYVQSGVLAQWLAIVMSGSARRMADDVDEAARLKALMFAVEEHPAYCFTDATLRQAQRRFKFMPTPSELLEFCDEIVAAEKLVAERLAAIVDIGVTTGAVMGSADVISRSMRLNRERADDERRELAAAAGIEVQHAPPQLPGETDRAYCLRLSALAKLQCDEGARARRRLDAQQAKARTASAAPAPAAAAVGESTPAEPSADTPADMPAAAPAESVGA